MTTALAIVALVQAVFLGAVALRLAWPVRDEAQGPDSVTGSVLAQDQEAEEAEGKLGFRR